MQFKDYYAVLGVPKSASADDIKRAFRKLARQYHPDVNPGDKVAEAKFKELNEAHEVLSDPEKRARYDELGANWQAREAYAGAASPWAAGGAPGGYRTMTPEEVESMFGGGGPFSDFFQTFFGGEDAPPRGRGARHRPRRGQDIEAVTELTLEEAFTGTTRRVSRSRGGREQTVEVRIPPGVADGARVRATGEGASGPAGGSAGDLYLTVRVRPHPRFERRGQDLYTRVAVPVTTAVLGGEASVTSLAGTVLRLRVPELTSTGKVFRLRGHGMPAVGAPEKRGDLYVTVDVQVPTTLSPEERRHYEALRAMARGAAHRHEHGKEPT